MKEETITLGLKEVTINFSTNNSELMEEVQKDFGIFEKNKVLKADGQMKVIQLEGEFPLKVPQYAIQNNIVPGNFSIFTLSNSRYREEKNCIYQVDAEQNYVLGYFRTSYDYFYMRFLLKWLFIKSLERKGIVFIHGSGVAKNDTSFFFVGPSGVGKTYTLVSFLLKGYKLITDDTIFFSNEEVLPFSLRSKISLDMLEKFPALRDIIEEKSTLLLPDLNQSEGGMLMNLGDIFSYQTKEIRPSYLFYLYVWNAPETKIESISKKEMLARLFHIYQIENGYSMWSHYREEEARRAVFPGFMTFVEEVNCYKVFAGTNPSSFYGTIRSIGKE